MRRMKRALAASTLITIALGSLPRAQSHLLDEGIAALLHEELSGEIAKEHVIAITRHHRIQGSRGYRAAAEWVLEKLREYGFDEDHAWIESFPSDGRIFYQTWQSPSGWDVRSAELRRLEPVEERIVGYPEIAMSLVTYSNPGDVTAELVWVGSGEREEDYAGRDVRGKLVLATGYGGAVHRLAVLQHGAAAVACYLDDERSLEYPDMLQYTGMWPRPDELERTTFGFNLTRRQGERLRAQLERGERVVVRGRVEGTGLEPFFMDVVVARIEGGERSEEELVFSAHLDHPKESANDNASGSGAILDIARGLRSLVAEARLPRPQRSFRFLWVPEWHGTMAYIDAHPEFRGPELGGKVLAAMNLDMVGEDLERLHSRLILTRTPDSLPACVDDVVADMADRVDRMDVRTPRGSLSSFNYRVTPYSGGSDHMMLIDRKIPAVMFSHDPDYTHHTSEDTPDKVDPVELERCEIIAAGTLWYLANLDRSQAADLAALVCARGAERIGEARRAACRGLRSATSASGIVEAFELGERRIEAALDRERVALARLAEFSPSAQVDALLTALPEKDEIGRGMLEGTLAEAFGAWPDMPAIARGDDRRVPVRTTRGPLAFDLPEGRLARVDAEGARPRYALSGDQRFELVNFVDGQRSVYAIRGLVEIEYGPLPLETVSRYFDDLVSVGAMAWK
jgi:hypothetical protein